MRTILSALFCTFVLALPSVGVAEDINTIFKKVNELIAANNYSKALEELGWARKEIERLHLEKIKGFFPATFGNFKGEDLDANSALGFLNVERSYRKDGGGEVKLSLTGGQSDAGGSLGGLAAFGKMAAMMQGNVPGQETFRVAGRTATLTEDKENQTAELSVFLESGGILKLDGYEGVTGAQLKEILASIKVEDLDKYLKGA